MALLPVSEARQRILADARPMPAETVALQNALGRVLAKPIVARRDQPPFPASAMDGYAVRVEDLGSLPATLRLVGTSAAGHGFRGNVKPGDACRIFTGAPLPRGADTVVIQENTETRGTAILVREGAKAGQNVRAAGLDFTRGQELVPAATVFNARDLGLAAAANAATVSLRRKPVVAVFATGDELVEPGGRPRGDQIVSSNTTALAALIRQFGGEPLSLGIIKDDLQATRAAVRRALKADIAVSTGGASVGDHDFVQEALKLSGVAIDFWKIAMRPGKPFMYGTKAGRQFLSLPGNPVSAFVCATLFLKPLLSKMLGLPERDSGTKAVLAAGLKANDGREDYVRATLSTAPDGSRSATPFAKQDSSMQRTLREAQCLIVRPPHAPEAQPGDQVDVLLLDF
ncbi:MAG: gephyrin-like molybdotransferase Glp [Aestuariivirga sp.]